MPSFSVGYGEKERLEVTLIGVPADVNVEGYDWIGARVQVEVGGFQGDVELTICLSDVISFKEQLEPVYRDLTGKAEFTTIEAQLYISIEVNKLGHVTATGYLIDELAGGNKLTFEITYDQTSLWHTIAEIDEALFELSPKLTS
jgi:hypothetical protein